MKHCSTSGTLRAYLDSELPEPEHTAVTAHLEQCAECRADLNDLRVRVEQMTLLLSSSTLSSAPDSDAALARIYATARPEHEPIQGFSHSHRSLGLVGKFRSFAVSQFRNPRTTEQLPRNPGSHVWPSVLVSRRTPMNRSQRLRRWAAPLAAIVLVAAMFALPAVRAAADQLLQVLRVQTVVFVPITQERMQQLKNINFDNKTLFLAEPKITNQPGEPQEVASADAAAAIVGFPIEQPATLPNPPTQTAFRVTGRTIAEFQINVASARELLQLTGVDDVTLPDALGAQPINVDMAPAVLATYTGDGYQLQLIQGRAPLVNLPDGIDLRQLGRAALRVLGMAPEQADALSNQIDWSSTLLFPFPSDLSSVRQVSINGAPGMLTTGGTRDGRTAQIYWQRGDHFYVLELEGVQSAEAVQILVQAAESVK
jgi:anti-sigma factor RsiW